MNKLFQSTVVLISLFSLACQKADSEPPPSDKMEASAEVKAEESEARKGKSALVLAYDDLREALASDDFDATKRAAKALAEVENAPEGVVTAAKAFADETDIEEARVTFGKVSEPYIAYLAANPDIAEGLIAFRCPMADPYKKWVQLEEPMRNPYMGQRMLECGAKVDMEP